MRPIKEPRRILILTQNWLGDVLFATPSIRAIRARFPQSHLACLAPRRVSEALAHNPHLNEVLVYDERAALLTFFEPFRVWKELRKRRFDTVFLFHRSRSKALLAMLAGIGARAGFARKGRNWLLTHAVEPPRNPVHKIDLFLYMLEAVGVPAAGRWPEVVPTAEEESSLERMLDAEGIRPGEPFSVLHAGGNWELKRWPVASFIRWIRLFREKNDWKTVLCGGASERPLADEIRNAFPDGRVVSLCGRTSLGELAALMKRARILVSNDSGPIHVAASQQTRILGLYGPTSPAETGPVSQERVSVMWRDVGCSVPCYFRGCNHRACMDLLTPEEALARAEELLR